MVVEDQDILEDLDLVLAHQVEELVLTIAGHHGLVLVDVEVTEHTVLLAEAEAEAELAEEDLAVAEQVVPQ
jgi:hypothetical protein